MFARAVWSIDLFGTEIRLDPAWILVAALMVWSLLSGFFPGRLPDLGKGDHVFLAIVATGGLFGSIVLHDVAQALARRRVSQGRVLRHDLAPDRAALPEEAPQSPGSELRIAVAGLAVPFTLGALAWLAFVALSRAGISPPVLALLEYLALINLALASLNLLPAYPLDGGRILRAARWRASHDLAVATREAGQVSALVALLLVGSGFVSLFSGAMIVGGWQVLIGILLSLAAPQAPRLPKRPSVAAPRLAGGTVAQLMSGSLHTAKPEDTLAEAIDRIILRHSRSFVPVTEGDQLLGYVDARLISAIDRENWDDTHVADIYVSSDETNTIPPDLEMGTVMRRMITGGPRKYMVAEQGRLLGVVTLADLTSHIALLQELDQTGAPGLAEPVGYLRA